MLEEEKAQAQQTLDEMWSEEAIPFQLTVHNIERGDLGCYTLQVLDNRIPSLFIYWTPDRGSFKAAVRAVVKHTVGQRSRAKGV